MAQEVLLGPMSRYRRVVWELYKGATEPLPCCSQGFWLLLRKNPKSDPKGMAWPQKCLGPAGHPQDLPSGTLLPSASQLHSGQLQEGYPIVRGWRQSPNLASSLPAASTEETSFCYCLYIRTSTRGQACVKEWPMPESCAKERLALSRGDEEADDQGNSSILLHPRGCQLGDTAISLKAGYTKSWQKERRPAEEIKENLF